MASFGFPFLRPADAIEQRSPMSELPPQAEQWQPSTLKRIGSALQGISKDELIAEHQAQQQAIQNRAQLRELMDKVLTDPRERLAFLSNQGEWAKSVSGNFGPSNVGEGDTRHRPGFDPFTAPKVIESGDSIISATPDSMEVLGRREPSFEEEAKADYNERLAEIKELLAGSKLARDAALTSQGNARLDIARRKAGGGAKAAPVTRRVLGATLPEGY